jgi:hypothetical protein
MLLSTRSGSVTTSKWLPRQSVIGFTVSTEGFYVIRYVPSCAVLAPVLQTRTMEQAKLLLVGHAWIGHCGARELLELLVRQEHERIQVTGKLS